MHFKGTNGGQTCAVELVWSKEWLVVTGQSPVLTAGPDLRFELTGLSPALAELLRSWETSGTRSEPTASDEDELRTLLLSLGALRPAVPDRPSVRLTSTEPLVELREALAARSVVLETLEPGTQPAIELAVRTDVDWPEVGAGLHLGVDLTHHHTLVFGPFVVPGLSSCLNCLARQTARRWGPDDIAPQPRVGRWVEILAELLLVQIELAVSGDYPLVNATVRWDLQSGDSDRERLFRAPDCGGPCRAPTADRIHLPWLTT